MLSIFKLVARATRGKRIQWYLKLLNSKSDQSCLSPSCQSTGQGRAAIYQGGAAKLAQDGGGLQYTREALPSWKEKQSSAAISVLVQGPGCFHAAPALGFPHFRWESDRFWKGSVQGTFFSVKRRMPPVLCPPPNLTNTKKG